MKLFLESAARSAYSKCEMRDTFSCYCDICNESVMMLCIFYGWITNKWTHSRLSIHRFVPTILSLKNFNMFLLKLSKIFRRVRKISKSDLSCLVCLAVDMEQLDFHCWADLSIFKKKSVQKIQIWNRTRITRTLYEDQYTFLIISPSVLLRMRNVSDKIFRENHNIYFIVSNVFHKVVLLWDNVEKCGGTRQATDDKIIQHMRISCWITKATHTYSEYVILIAFPLQ
jgi:hypothetical protein